FNGTIYNYRELREELRGKGYAFFSAGDSEVILKAWHAWGEDCVDHLQGMFAFALWDYGEKQLFMARDRLGIKPFYYSLTKSRFRFAS
ncbi:N-acetylglutaminylglutamine amidotransferase, partial [Bacillus thuringiensis]|nr:N-acetylglutaminylglutamine amidotransferase [Bacillus thuringiensis]